MEHQFLAPRKVGLRNPRHQGHPGLPVRLDSPFFTNEDEKVRWQPLPAPARFDWPDYARHPIQSLIHAIETGGQPVCSGSDGRWAIEMVAAVYEAQRTRARVTFPLADRGNPLLRF